MQISQTARKKVFLQFFELAFLSLALAFFIAVAPASAVGTDAGSMNDAMNGRDSTSAQAMNDRMNINVNAQSTTQAVKKGAWERLKDQIKSWTWQKTLEEIKKAGDVAWKAALKNFLNTLAYDMANYLATGDKGQLPMFQTGGWGGYMQGVADNAAGTFIEALGKGSTLKFNLCNPDFRVLLKINLGLTKYYRPKPPACTFSQMTKNWDTALKGKDFLPKFQDMFNPWSNDLGIALTLQTGIETQVSRDVNAAIKDREESGGFKAVKDIISDSIKTPGALVRAMTVDAAGAAKQSALAYTGSVVADSIDIFINTLAGKLIEKWLRGGIVTKFPTVANKLDNLSNPNAQNPAEGLAGAQDRMKSLVEPTFKSRADYDVLTELTTCPDPNKAGPTGCVLSEKFRQAIEKRMTVRDALDQGYLNGNGIFGFTSDGLEPKFNEGYPYRSMLILRKFRIIPVGWEVAAQYIKDCQNNSDPAKCKIGITPFNVSGTKNLKDLVSCFSDDAQPLWCRGLVDPDWVLKAPQNFCKREGAGSEIISEQVTGAGSDSSLSILRDDTYCADEQSVITEKSDGSPVFGYCTEERRTWDFNAKGCTPRSNTCQSFGASDGQTYSYLENTLSFGPPCNIGNAGCKKYAIAKDGSYDSTAKAVDWTKSDQAVYLNKQAETCDAGSEGCHALIRLNSGGGANLLANADFEEPFTNNDWANFGDWTNPNAPATFDADLAYQGSHSLKINNPITRNIAVGTALAGDSYALSFYAKDCKIGDNFSIEEKPLALNAGGNWTRYSLVYNYPVGWDDQTITFKINSADCLIDNIKLERGSQATNFSDYGVAGSPSLIHEKLLPDYLKNVCWADKGDYYEPITGAPAACSNFARQCKEPEAGCELYTSVATENKIPAKVTRNDYCPAECVGYNSFVQGETIFDNKRDSYFIPKTSRACSAEANGCDQFTNLDETAKGGEGVTYYTYLRQCIKPDTNQCGDFYNWEGSDESGFQLKVESLKKDKATGDPVSTMSETEESKACNAVIYNLTPSNPAYNPDCRQFYNHDGGVSYHLYKQTITCTDDCHPYRRTEINELTVADCESNCASGDDACKTACDTNVSCSTVQSAGNEKNSCKLANGDVILCKNGGTWDASNNACIYMAIPSQGMTCSAAQSGCREYTGNTGNNVRKILTDDFTDGVGDWSGVTGISGSAVISSNEAINLGADNKGHSIKVTNAAKRQIGTAVTGGLSYVLSFVAKADKDTSPVTLTATLSNGAGADSAFAASPELTTAWQIYTINLSSLGHKVSAGEVLTLSAAKNATDKIFYIDSITLTEVTDKYYLIKNSWKTPVTCDEDTNGDASLLYMLGCDQYTDRASKVNNLRKFSELCSESAVGCELMIDTHNSTNPNEENNIPADNPIYAAYDPDKLCGADEKGCALLGQSYKYEGTTLYSDIYLKNNPDNYKTILCAENAVGCEAFAYDNGTTNNGEKYFKNPGDQVCEWRKETDKGTSENWFKKKVKRCGSNGDVCLTAADCPIPGAPVCASDADCGQGNNCINKKCYKSCQLETADTKCPTDTDPGNTIKTLGVGGTGGVISQPSNGWAGLCPAEDSGCGEYLDPLSKFNTNIIFNGSFQKLAVNNWDGWAGSGPYTQSKILEPNTVYRLARLEQQPGKFFGYLSISCPSPAALYEIKNEITNNGNPPAQILADPLSKIQVDPPTGANYVNSKIFYYKGDASSCTITAENSNGAVELKKIAVDYQLAQNLDKKSCNGQVNPGQGCVLFNERKQSGAGLAALTWDADLTKDGPTPVGETGQKDEEKDSNVILKVAPDRVCNKWLACKSYIKDAKGDNVCFDLGLCDAVDANNNCQSFISSPKKNQTVEYLTTAEIANLSGYSKVGIKNGSLINDFYPLGAMEQKGEVANMSNGGFEYYGSNLYPIGWTWGGQPADKSWDANVFSVINNPIAAQTEGIGYAPEGAAFLKLGSSYDAVSEPVDVMPNVDYVITAFVNTKNLKNGIAMIDVVKKDYKIGEAPIAPGIIKQDLGNDWNFQIGRFNTGDNSQIKIRLYSFTASGKSEGNFYFDSIKIRPALNTKTKVSKCLPGYCVSDNGGNNGHCSNNSNTQCLVSEDKFWYAPQSCRLYPQSDALSCDYYEDSGIRQKGWYGYCLEYDRRPGDPSVCLLWYPIDKVKGDGIEEGAGYAGKAPVYYSLEGKTERFAEYRHAFYYGRGAWDGCGNIENGQACGQNNVSCCGLNYDCVEWGIDTQDGWDNVSIACIPNGKNLIISDGSVDSKANITPTSEKDGWYSNYDGIQVYNNSVKIDSTNKFNKYLCDGLDSCSLTKELFRTRLYSTKIAQTVTSVGQNKYWSSRVYKGSDYAVPNLGFTFNSDSAPFGSIVPPSSINNPYEWDGDGSKNFNQPIYYNTPESGLARMGQIYNCVSTEVNDGKYVADMSAGDFYPYIYLDLSNSLNNNNSVESIKRLFAQSYGVWNWTGTNISGRYEEATPNQDWTPPPTICSGPNGTRPDYITNSNADYCAIPPTITNVKVNGSIADIIRTNSEFIKLSFNTKADSQQLPLVMYGVDWGDDSKTIVTGVEMRDKPDPDSNDPDNDGSPEIIYHLYSYWDLKAKANQGKLTNGGSCGNNTAWGNYCQVKPSVQIKDNWGWCNGGNAINNCGQWQSFDKWVVVKEK